MHLFYQAAFRPFCSSMYTNAMQRQDTYLYKDSNVGTPACKMDWQVNTSYKTVGTVFSRLEGTKMAIRGLLNHFTQLSTGREAGLGFCNNGTALPLLCYPSVEHFPCYEPVKVWHQVSHFSINIPLMRDHPSHVTTPAWQKGHIRRGPL